MSLLVSFKIIRGTFLNTMHLLRIQAPSGMFVNVWQLSLGKKKRPWFPLFPNFHGVNTLTTANFKLQHESLNKEGGGWRDINIQCSCEPVSASSNTSSPLNTNRGSSPKSQSLVLFGCRPHIYIFMSFFWVSICLKSHSWLILRMSPSSCPGNNIWKFPDMVNSLNIKTEASSGIKKV